MLVGVGEDLLVSVGEVVEQLELSSAVAAGGGRVFMGISTLENNLAPLVKLNMDVPG